MQFNLFNPDYYITIHTNLVCSKEPEKKELFIRHNKTGNYYFYEF